jgi:hypothetical protein
LTEPDAPADGWMIPAPAVPRPRRGRRIARTCLVLSLLALVLVPGHRPLLVGFAHLFRVDNPAPCDALVVLPDVTDSVDVPGLFRRGLAPTVLMVTTDPVPFPDLNRSEVGRQILIRCGVPADAMRALPSVGLVEDTRRVALRLRDDARVHPLRRITVVTTALRTARTRWIFRRALRGTGIEVRMAAARDPRFDEADWYTKDEGLVAYFQETLQWLVDWFAS